MSWRPRGAWLDTAGALLLTVVILGPALVSRGFVLRGDMVFVPDQPWKDAWLGLDGAVPRAAPMDAVVWLLGQGLPGDLVQKVLLVAVLLGAGTGASRLVAGRRWFARLAVITLYVWNPWVLERLSIGQWAVVAGYALLPWAAVAAVRVRDDIHRWPGLAVVLVLAGVCGPPAGGMCAVVAVVVCGFGGIRPGATAAGLAVLANLPWALPSILLPGGVTATEGAFTAFAARAESDLGPLASLLSFGGIWKSAVVPGERQSEFVIAMAALLTLLALSGLRRAAARGDRQLVVALVIAGAAGLGTALLGAMGPTQAWLDDLAVAWPWLAILRDGHRWLAPFILCLLPGLAERIEWLAEAARRGAGAIWAVVALVVVAPVLLLPGLAWGIAGEFRPVTYPDSWDRVARLVGESDDPRTVVVPWRGGYRGFAWNHRQASLDPAPRILPGDVLIDDRVFGVEGRMAGSETPNQRRLTEALGSDHPAAALRALGVRWVLVEKDQPGAQWRGGGSIAHDDRWLRLVDLGPTTAGADVARPPALPVIIADAAVLLVLLVATCLLVGNRVYAPAGRFVLGREL